MAEAMDTTEPSSQASEKTKPLTYSEKQWLNVKKNFPTNRTRARNERFRKMLNPKNAVMALSELLKEDGNDIPQFQFDQCMRANHTPMYSATLTIKTLDFPVMGFADSKSKAKNNAAEQALKAIYLERLKKVNKMDLEWMAKKEKRHKEWEERQKKLAARQKQKDGIPRDAEEVATEKAKGTNESQGEEGKDQERVTLPMVQLTAFALYKLYSSWESQGYVVPIFHSSDKKSLNPNANKKDKLKAKKAAKRRQLPLNASSLHPGFLLYYMCPGIEYKDAAIDGQRGQQTFVVSVETEGKSYLGKGKSKKEARRLAALAACEDLFQVKFEQNSMSNVLVLAEEDAADATNMPEPMEQSN